MGKPRGNRGLTPQSEEESVLAGGRAMFSYKALQVKKRVGYAAFSEGVVVFGGRDGDLDVGDASSGIGVDRHAGTVGPLQGKARFSTRCGNAVQRLRVG